MFSDFTGLNFFFFCQQAGFDDDFQYRRACGGLAYGLALATSSIQVVVRDIEHLIGPVLMLMFYLTPILYPRTLVPEGFRFVVDWNPVAHLLGTVRDGMLRGDLGSGWVLLPLSAGAILLVWLGQLVFRRLAESFEEFI